MIYIDVRSYSVKTDRPKVSEYSTQLNGEQWLRLPSRSPGARDSRPHGEPRRRADDANSDRSGIRCVRDRTC